MKMRIMWKKAQMNMNFKKNLQLTLRVLGKTWEFVQLVLLYVYIGLCWLLGELLLCAIIANLAGGGSHRDD